MPFVPGFAPPTDEDARSGITPPLGAPAGPPMGPPPPGAPMGEPPMPPPPGPSPLSGPPMAASSPEAMLDNQVRQNAMARHLMAVLRITKEDKEQGGELGDRRFGALAAGQGGGGFPTSGPGLGAPRGGVGGGVGGGVRFGGGAGGGGGLGGGGGGGGLGGV